MSTPTYRYLVEYQDGTTHTKAYEGTVLLDAVLAWTKAVSDGQQEIILEGRADPLPDDLMAVQGLRRAGPVTDH
jgi:hypothetical protein